MAQRRASKAKGEMAPSRAPVQRQKAKAGETGVAERLAALERERDALKEELARSRARVRELEEGQAQVRDRIAWALDTLRNILQGKG